AFWKIEGFEVSPVTERSSTRCFSSPEWTSSRESKSIQTDCPRAASSASLDSAILHPPFHGSHLLQPCHVALAAVEAGCKDDADELARDRRPDDLGAEAEDVHVVVLDRLVRAVEVVADSGTDAGHLAGGDRRPGTGSADQDAALGAAGKDLVADLSRLVRV